MENYYKNNVTFKLDNAIYLNKNEISEKVAILDTIKSKGNKLVFDSNFRYRELFFSKKDMLKQGYAHNIVNLGDNLYLFEIVSKEQLSKNDCFELMITILKEDVKVLHKYVAVRNNSTIEFLYIRNIASRVTENSVYYYNEQYVERRLSLEDIGTKEPKVSSNGKELTQLTTSICQGLDKDVVKDFKKSNITMEIIRQNSIVDRGLEIIDNCTKLLKTL